jgi:hypothetical protein
LTAVVRARALVARLERASGIARARDARAADVEGAAASRAARVIRQAASPLIAGCRSAGARANDRVIALIQPHRAAAEPRTGRGSVRCAVAPAVRGTRGTAGARANDRVIALIQPHRAAAEPRTGRGSVRCAVAPAVRGTRGTAGDPDSTGRVELLPAVLCAAGRRRIGLTSGGFLASVGGGRGRLVLAAAVGSRSVGPIRSHGPVDCRVRARVTGVGIGERLSVIDSENRSAPHARPGHYKDRPPAVPAAPWRCSPPQHNHRTIS